MNAIVTVKSERKAEKLWADQASRTGPMHLLDLPMDILQAIIKEITHTNDLTSLALTHSTLHALVTPHIYARFDIVWPDAGPAIESRVGVDALTYGLATLVMAQDIFGEGGHKQIHGPCAQCGSLNFCQHLAPPSRPVKTRRGNHFAQFTRKFSLGNGPEDWVKEYLITKEGGKMLGTLVALAVGRMRNLESFTWDMPTGVVRDIWLALASLENREDGQACRLERVWVRWHDNQDTIASPPRVHGPSGLVDMPYLISGAGKASFSIPPYPRVEFPTFSVLPPLKSLSVLDIDEPSYVEEVSVLLERSLSQLVELRIGLAHHAQSRPWARPREDRSLVPPPLTRPNEQIQRSGGLLGILVSRFCPAFNDKEALVGSDDMRNGSQTLQSAQNVGLKPKEDNNVKVEQVVSVEGDVDRIGALLSAQNLEDELLEDTEAIPDTTASSDAAESQTCTTTRSKTGGRCDILEGNVLKLKLHSLELERLYLSIPVLSTAFDWSRLRTLTILGCREHEQFWKTLRKKFVPPQHSRKISISNSGIPITAHLRRRSDSGNASLSVADYRLGITRLHTDAVSATLLAFIRDTLAPDSLELLFLQQTPMYKSTVTVDQIYKHVIRRHRGSLKKLLIDSDIRIADGSPDGGSHWRKWAVTRELITCITSGRMQLQELSMSIDYKDWHYFLQRLPDASKLRSLHIKHIADYVHNRIDPREAALQVLDIVALRPELELCYLGIQGKCFEILEYAGARKFPSVQHDRTDDIPLPNTDDDDDDDDDDDEDVSDELEEQGNNVQDGDSDDLNLLTDEDDTDETDDEVQSSAKKASLRLREILFYDDKISIFKARHGRL